MKVRVLYNKTSKSVRLVGTSTAAPGGYTIVGEISNPDPVAPNSSVIWHAVRDVLYKRSAANPANTAMFPNNITDMDRIAIEPYTLVPLTDLSLAIAGGANKVVGQTGQITPTFTPADATDKVLVYSSSNPTVATVSATGLVTAVAAGSASITATSEDGINKSIVVTVTAA